LHDGDTIAFDKELIYRVRLTPVQAAAAQTMDDWPAAPDDSRPSANPSSLSPVEGKTMYLSKASAFIRMWQARVATPTDGPRPNQPPAPVGALLAEAALKQTVPGWLAGLETGDFASSRAAVAAGRPLAASSREMARRR